MLIPSIEGNKISTIRIERHLWGVERRCTPASKKSIASTIAQKRDGWPGCSYFSVDLSSFTGALRGWFNR
jgi:hypothetical protein